MKRLILIIILTISLISNVFSQSDTLDISKYQSKNNVYINLGVGGVSFVLNVNYERKIVQTNNHFLSSLWIKGQGGLWAVWDSEGTQFSLVAVGLSGQKNNHFEYGLGISSLYDETGYSIEKINYNHGHGSSQPTRFEFTSIVAYVNFGYRYQNPFSGLVFRTGIGFPAGLYLSLGYAF